MGSTVGCCDGQWVGRDEGKLDGNDVGPVGFKVGKLDGSLDGSDDGTSVG